MENLVVKSYDSFNERRYSSPWVCKMTKTGGFDFKTRVGCYTGNGRNGEAGDLIIFNPEAGAVYGYGQKDYRKPRYTEVSFALFDGDKLVPCDKLGRVKE